MGQSIILSDLETYYSQIVSILNNENIIEYYPNFNEWIMKIKNRKILILKNGSEIAGFVILKETDRYVKLCTFYVCREYRNKGYSYNLINYIMKRYNNILITVPEELYYIYIKIFSKYPQISTTIYKEKGKYRQNKYEYIIILKGEMENVF